MFTQNLPWRDRDAMGDIINLTCLHFLNIKGGKSPWIKGIKLKTVIRTSFKWLQYKMIYTKTDRHKTGLDKLVKWRAFKMTEVT